MSKNLNYCVSVIYIDIFQLFRHGDRTPDKVGMYPTDPHLNDTYYPYGLGALTNVSISITNCDF